MKKFTLTFYCSILLMFCQVSGFSMPVAAISATQEQAISTNCNSLKDTLKTIQKNDAKARVYLGSYYETILTKFITPLNVRLVENNLSNASLVENQNKFVENKSIFSNDFIRYQQSLEELVSIDCKNNPTEFYEKLSLVRDRRKIMNQDVLKMRNLLSEHLKLVNALKGKL